MSALTLPGLTIPFAAIQGPLAGYSCAPMRRLAAQFGGVGYTCTEMLSAHNIARGVRQPLRYRYKAPDEGLLCVQLSGTDPSDLATASAAVVQAGADMVDLNCGCPQPKIRKKGQGSRLLADPDRLYTLVRAMRMACSVPLSVKIRVDGDSGDQYTAAVVAAIAAAGADLLVVHGRHWRERYDTPVRVAALKDVVSLSPLPVIVNGDVTDRASYQALLTQTGAAGVMVSRAALGRPWVFRQLHDADFDTPDQATVAALLWQHVKGLAALEGDVRALLQVRKLLGYYFPALAGHGSSVSSWADLEACLSHAGVAVADLL